MARKSYTRKTSRGGKIQPAVQTFSFVSEVNGPTIDLSQCASLMNRRFYRQGINWAVAGFKFASESSGRITVSKLPNTWVMSNAWEKGFRAWQRMNREALSESESVKPRFLDFKIYADSLHHAAGYASNLLPLTLTSGVATPGEWESSKFQIPDTTTASGVQDREIVAVGPNYPGVGASGLNAISLIEGYAASRALPDIADPNTPTDALRVDGSTPQNWIAATFSDGTQQTDAVITDMVTENNQAPYPYEDDGIHIDTMYPGGANQLVGLQIHDYAQIFSTSASTNIGIVTSKGGNFPCGLVRIDWAPETPGVPLTIQVDLVPGNHRGYLCEPMTEM
ncbi:MAG: putative capsid protein [Circular genetic element sp.]|nr:MAG: putative capsid protein [Circular genetic element sp.]